MDVRTFDFLAVYLATQVTTGESDYRSFAADFARVNGRANGAARKKPDCVRGVRETLTRESFGFLSIRLRRLIGKL